MLETIKTNLLLPLLGRAGTAIATVLVTYGVAADPAQQIGLGVTAAGLVLGDLFIDWLARKRSAK